MADPLDVTVVVPTRDRPEMLDRCLGALLATQPRPAEVIVVDSASGNAAATDPARERGLTVVRCERPGASRARNAGSQVAQHRVIAFVDDDVEVATDWVARLVAPLDDGSGIVLVTGGVDADTTSAGRSVATTDDVAAGRFTREHVGNVGASASLAVRRDVFEAAGGFDEMLGAGAPFRAAEDIDLFDRMLVLGAGWHEPDARAVHRQWRDRRALARLELAYGTGFGARMVKLARADRRRARAVARYELARLRRDVVGDLRNRYEFGLLSRALWVTGFVMGAVRAALVPVRDGVFRPRRSA